MEVFYTPKTKTNLSLALGFFDGIHSGHKKVIENAVNYAKKNNLRSAVVSFVEHPACFLLNRNPEYIIDLNDKIKKIEKLGVDYLYLLNFDKNLSEISKEEYFEFLCNLTSPKSITTGFNHFFGKDKQGDTNFLNEICKIKNINYTKIEPVKINNEIVSSSKIRHAIMNADFKTSKSMLDYDFYIKGVVIKGRQIGRQIGFNTININYPEKIIKIPYGVYCSIVEIDNKIYKAVTNWGVKPTITGENLPVVEAHLLNFNENIYGKNVKISFLTKIRNEKKFDTLNDLKNQIEKDVEFCKTYIA